MISSLSGLLLVDITYNHKRLVALPFHPTTFQYCYSCLCIKNRSRLSQECWLILPRFRNQNNRSGSRSRPLDHQFMCFSATCVFWSMPNCSLSSLTRPSWQSNESNDVTARKYLFNWNWRNSSSPNDWLIESSSRSSCTSLAHHKKAHRPIDPTQWPQYKTQRNDRLA